LTTQQQRSPQRWIKGIMLNVMPGMITCEEFEQFIVDYLEGDLPSKQLSLFERHLRMCRECRDYLTAYQRTMEMSRAACESSSDSLQEEVPEDLIKAILDARKS